MAPSLALSYSSQAPIYGGIAAGWSLPLGLIRQDTSHGRMVAGTANRFLINESRLVEVTEPHGSDVSSTYRIANGDTSFTRYERLTPGAVARWRARATDGSISLFGEPAYTSGCTNVDDGFAPLTRTIDVYGNEVAYFYEEAIDFECRIQKIEWGQNSNAGITNPFAKVAFTWEAGATCNGVAEFHIGGQHDYRTGKLIRSGASRLTAITATAFAPGSPGSPVHTRTITLGYDIADEHRCGTTGHASSRRLVSIQESASGTDSPLVTLPAVTFDYGDPTVDLATASGTSTPPWGDALSHYLPPRTQNLAWGVRHDDDRWPTVEAMMLDIDGDGLLDRVINSSSPGTTGECLATWQRNLGPGNSTSGLPTFGTPVGMTETITLPRLKWRGGAPVHPAGGATAADSSYKENCALNGQVTAFENSDPGTLCHVSGLPCSNGEDPDNQGPYCYPNGTACVGPGTVPSPFRTYLAYRWLDMDSDGLADLVAAVHGNINRYDIERGNRVGYNGGEPNLFGPWPSCPKAEVDRCKDISAQCADATRICLEGQPCFVDDSAFDACITSAPETGCDELIRSLPQGGLSGDPRRPYTRCEGLYPWFIYKNYGQGDFAETPVIKYQPVPLESDTGDSNISGTRIASQRHAVMDFDGDGILDAVVRPITQTGSPWWWEVWSGDGTGGFGSSRHIFHTRTDFDDGNAIAIHGPIASGEVVEKAGLMDANGDGLPDHWLRRTANNANIAFHLGARKFALFGVGLASGPVGSVNTPTSPPLIPGNETNKVITWPSPWNPGSPVEAGETTARTRTLDVDHDGRIDIVRWGTPPQVFFNFGGQFSSASSNYPTNTGGLQRKTIADNGVPFTWELDGDVIDLDGDGIGESVYFDSGGFKRFVRAVPADGAPPRLLQAIHNGRGGHALVTYAQMHDGSAVVQDPAATWFDGRPKATPRTQWVVKAVRNTDDFAGTDSTTSYLYLHPRHGADDEGRFAFRGFEEVWTTSPSLMKTVQRYDYAGDWSGRLAQVLVVPGEAASEVRSISKTKWTGRALFNFAVTSYFPTAVETWTCATGQNEAACLAAPAGYTVSESTLTDFPLIGDKRLILETGSKLSNANVDNDRQTIRTFTMLVDATSYLVRPVSTTKEHRVAGTMVMYAKSAQEWEPTLKAPTTEETWFDSNDANRAKTSLVFDLTTGNLLERRKPVQNDAGTSSAIFEYDSRKLFVAKETNELGHVRDFQWEYGTGTKLQTDGPDIRTCTACDPPTPDQPLKEQTKIRVDGLGRTIERWDTNSEDGGSFVLYQRELTSYVDNATPTIPASTTHQVRKTTSIASSWTNVKTELDGHGRPLRTIQLAQGTAPADAITSYAYANDGTLQSVSVPDPTQNNASTVTYRYTFDSLGRAISIRRPDSITVANQSGVDITYNGVTKTVREVTGVAGGLAAATKTVTDSFGRLVEVHEKYAGPGNGQSEQFAITHYTYGPDDNVIAVVDPQSVTTQLQHDFAGRRTQIVRHGRTWKYTYDKNGNLISEQVPGSPNPPVTDPDYTTTIVYDALDRPVSKLVGARGMSATDQTLFAGRSETFQWDYGGNMKGHLRYWTSYAPNASTPTLKREMRRTDLDLGSTDKVSFFGLAGLTTSHQTLARYNLAGLPSSTHHYDQVAPSNHNTVSTIQYDANLRPTKIDFNNINSGQPVHALAVQTRNVAGLVTKRRTVFVPGTADYVESNWTYDTLGRITDQLVQTTPGPVQVARQTLTYLGNDNPSTLGHTIGASAKSFQYGYDFRHQITSAAETTTPGYFTSAYVYGPAGRFTGTNIAQTNPAPGSELIPRNVAYQYADPDPERVTALLLAGGSTRFASYQYDEAGNMTSRCYGASAAPCVGESVEFLYDGKDQLRRATKKLNGVVQGSEEYWYDHEGSRVAIVKRDASGTKTETIVFRGDVEAHYDSANTLDFVYTHVSLGTPVARLKRTNTGIELEHQFHGLANHTLVAVSSAGTINSAFSYTPFGEVVETVDAGNGEGAAAHPRRFNDKYQDAISALAYYGARCFDRTLIGWSQSDPLYSRVPDAALHGNPRRANQYQFSLSNPLMYLDPDGLDSFGGTGNVGSYRSEMESSTRGWAANTSSDLVDTQSCEYSSSRCPPRWTLFADLNQKKSAEAKQIPIPEFAPEDSDVRFAPPGWEKDLRCSTPDQCKLAKRIGVAWLVLLTPVVVATIPAMVRGASATRVGPVATTVLDTNRIHHIFGQARHNLDPLVARFGGSREAAYTAVESATQTVVRSQRLSGVFETAVRVADFNVVVRGRVMDNVARISTFFIP